MKKFFEKRSVLASVAALASGTAFSQAVYIVILPLLSRLYSPADFAVLTLYLSIVGVTSVLATWRYEYAILVSKEDREARSVVWLIWSIAAGASVLILTVGLGLRFIMPSLLPDVLTVPVIIAVGFSLLLTGMFQGLYFYANRHKEYRRLAQNRIAGAVAVAAGSCALGWLKAGGIGLVVASLLGQVVNWILLAGWFFREPVGAEPRPDRKSLFSLANRFKRYPQCLILSGLLDRFSSQVHILFFSYCRLTESVGLIGLCQKAVSTPMSTVGGAISDIFRQKASETLQKNGQCTTLFWKTAGCLLALGIIPSLALVLFGPDLFGIVFGAAWREAGIYARIMAPMFLFGFVVSTVSNLIFVGEKPQYDLFLQILLIVVVVPGLIVGYAFGSARTALACYVAVYCIKYCVEFCLSLRIARGGKRNG